MSGGSAATAVWWQRGHTPRGHRDIGYQSAWIIGAVYPARETGVAFVLTRLDTEAMNLFLAELSQAVAPGAHGVVLMDKAGWHTAGDLVAPDNLSLVFLPPYSPELNPIERLWLRLRTIASRTASFAPPRNHRRCWTAGIGCSPRPAASVRYAPIPGSNGSLISQDRYNIVFVWHNRNMSKDKSPTFNQ